MIIYTFKDTKNVDFVGIYLSGIRGVGLSWRDAFGADYPEGTPSVQIEKAKN